MDSTPTPEETSRARPETCSNCGAPLQSGALDGICAACLLEDVGHSWTESETLDSRSSSPVESCFFVPGHEVLEEIASGGMGVVYRARQLEPPREVALKMLLPAQTRSAELRERFRIETRAAAALDHPAILPLYELGEQDGLPWFTMK